MRKLVATIELAVHVVILLWVKGVVMGVDYDLQDRTARRQMLKSIDDSFIQRRSGAQCKPVNNVMLTSVGETRS